MKTATLKLNFHSVLLAFLVTAVGCQKDEFFEKEYLENPFVPEEVVDPSDTGGTTGGDTGDTTGGSTGGSTTGTTDGGATGGTTTGGTTVGGTTGGTTTGTTDGGTTGGSTTGGTTTGGTTVGGTTGGSTTGTTDGGTTGGSTTGSNPQWIDESFTQSSSANSKLDILWVIDSSGSMSDEQASLGANFDLFINDFITKGIDFKMGITTTDTTATSAGNGGRDVTGAQAKLTSVKAAEDKDQFLEDFENLVKVGIRGSGNERGLQASEMYVNRYKDSWMRSDAYFVVVYLSDEEDQSSRTPAEYLAFLQASKSSAGFFKAYSIVGMTGCPAGVSGYSCGYARYAHVSDNSGGSKANIQGNFATILSAMGQEIITLLDTFPLSHDVIPGTMEVRFDGVLQVSGWEVDGRQLKILSGSVPAVGTNITVRYQY